LQVGVLEFPIPSAKRCYKLGQSLRRAILTYPEDLTVCLVATGGLSHQVHGERCGFNNTEWDLEFLELIENNPARLIAMTHADYAWLGGVEGAEVIMWLVMRGALSPRVRKLHQSYYLPSMTGIATALYEDTGPLPTEPDRHYFQHVNHQLAGLERLDGSYPFTLARSVKGYRLNKFLHALIDPAWRARFRTEQEALFEEARLTAEERDLVRRLDWRAMIHYGVSFFMLEKLGAVVGVSNLHIYAAMRGQTLEEFQQTRNAPGALYSVAGSDAGQQQPSWDTTPVVAS
jgi:gallate dioxygenase